METAEDYIMPPNDIFEADPAGFVQSDRTVALPAILTKTASDQAGGWKITFHIPEIAKEQLKQLIGTENKINYAITCTPLDEIVEQPRKKPGPKPRGKE